MSKHAPSTFISSTFPCCTKSHTRGWWSTSTAWAKSFFRVKCAQQGGCGRTHGAAQRESEERIAKSCGKNAQRSTLKFGRGKRRLALAMEAGRAVSPRPPPTGRADARPSLPAESQTSEISGQRRENDSRVRVLPNPVARASRLLQRFSDSKGLKLLTPP